MLLWSVDKIHEIEGTEKTWSFQVTGHPVDLEMSQTNLQVSRTRAVVVFTRNGSS